MLNSQFYPGDRVRKTMPGKVPVGTIGIVKVVGSEYVGVEWDDGRYFTYRATGAVPLSLTTDGDRRQVCLSHNKAARDGMCGERSSGSPCRVIPVGLVDPNIAQMHGWL